MDPISMIFSFALNNPQAAADMADAYRQPGQVDVQQLQSSVADFAMQTLNCYHKSARFRGVTVLGAPWRGHAMFGAQGSVVLRISFSGLSGTPYQMVVAAMAQERAVRTHVLQENTVIPYNRHCPLEQWTDIAS